MIDIVYTYKFDPHTTNRQLIYSLRSLEKHLKGNIGKVFVIGADPELFHVAHILSSTQNHPISLSRR